jgi:hypothetical protein
VTYSNSTRPAERAPRQIETRSINPGPTHSAELYAFIGLPEGSIPPGRWNQLGNCIYEPPAWHATALPDGRVLVEVERGYGSLYTVLPDRDAFAQWRRTRELSVRDPETGRAR